MSRRASYLKGLCLLVTTHVTCGRDSWTRLCEKPSMTKMFVQIMYQMTLQGKCLHFPDTVPSEFRTLGERCLDPDPTNRPTFDQILDTLRRM